MGMTMLVVLVLGSTFYCLLLAGWVTCCISREVAFEGTIIMQRIIIIPRWLEICGGALSCGDAIIIPITYLRTYRRATPELWQIKHLKTVMDTACSRDFLYGNSEVASNACHGYSLQRCLSVPVDCIEYGPHPASANNFFLKSNSISCIVPIPYKFFKVIYKRLRLILSLTSLPLPFAADV